MREFDAIVIGAGNGGMLAANALQKDGARTIIIEKHNTPGGAAESFCRGRFEFEAALHQLTCLGTEDHPGITRKVFDELGITEKVDWLEMPNIACVIVPGQITIPLPANREKMVATLSRIFPDEKAGIEKYFEVIYGIMENYHALLDFDFNSKAPLSRMDPEATAEKYPYFYKYAFMPLPQFFAQTLNNPLLIGALSTMTAYSGPVPECTVLDIANWTYYYMEYKPYHVHGCSFSFSSALMESFRRMGGTLLFNTAVEKILVENGRAVGVVTEYGEEIRAKEIIGNLSPMLVYQNMIDPNDVPASAVPQSKGYVVHGAPSQVFLGLDCEPWDVGIPDTNNFVLVPEGRLIVTCHDVADPSVRGSGKCTVTLLISDLGVNWLNIPPEKYFEKKYEMAEKMLAIAEKAFPGIRDHIEEMEISSSVTNARFMGAPGGAIAGLKTYSRDYLLFPVNNDQIPGLTFCGAWDNSPGGMHPSMMSGWNAGHEAAKRILNG